MMLATNFQQLLYKYSTSCTVEEPHACPLRQIRPDPTSRVGRGNRPPFATRWLATLASSSSAFLSAVHRAPGLRPRPYKYPRIPSTELTLPPPSSRCSCGRGSCAHNGAQGDLQGRGGVARLRAPGRPFPRGAGVGPPRLRVGAGDQGRGASHVRGQQLRHPRDQVRTEWFWSGSILMQRVIASVRS
jgi:hypothetical protein